MTRGSDHFPAKAPTQANISSDLDLIVVVLTFSFSLVAWGRSGFSRTTYGLEESTSQCFLHIVL